MVWFLPGLLQKYGPYSHGSQISGYSGQNALEISEIALEMCLTGAFNVPVKRKVITFSQVRVKNS